MAIKWRIYYSDGTTFSSDEGAWADAPAYMVVCVVTRDPTDAHGRFVLTHNHEYYYKASGHEPMVSEEVRNIALHVPNLRLCELKFGGNAWQDEWQAIQYKASRDPDFPRCSPRRRSTDLKGDPREPKYRRGK